MKNLLCILVTGVILFSCNQAPKEKEITSPIENKEAETINNIIEMTVASQKGNCVGVAPQECLIVKMGNDTDWTFLYSVIEGFNYEEGHEYIIKVRTENIDPVPADASSIKYIFMEEVSKINKESENLPFGIEENLS